MKYSLLATVASFMGGIDITDADELAELTALVTAAELLAEAYMQQSLVGENDTAKIFSTRSSGQTVFLPWFRDVSLVELGAETTAAYEVDADLYVKYPDAPRIGLYNGLVYLGDDGRWLEGDGTLRVTADWGFAPTTPPVPLVDYMQNVTPADVSYAISLITKYLYGVRDRDDFARFRSNNSESVQYIPDRDLPRIPMLAKALLTPYVNRWRNTP